MAVFMGAVVVVATPPVPSDVQIVPPDPALPKELAAFSGKWEGSAYSPTGKVMEFFLIVEKIDKEKASLYVYSQSYGWERIDAQVAKEYGKYVIWFAARPRGVYRVKFIKGDKLELFDSGYTLSVTYTRADI